MCTYSMVADHYQKLTPLVPDWTWAKWLEYQEAIQKAKELDLIMKQKDCEDAHKTAFEKEVLKHLKKLGERMTQIEQRMDVV